MLVAEHAYNVQSTQALLVIDWTFFFTENI